MAMARRGGRPPLLRAPLLLAGRLLLVFVGLLGGASGRSSAFIAAGGRGAVRSGPRGSTARTGTGIRVRGARVLLAVGRSHQSEEVEQQRPLASTGPSSRRSHLGSLLSVVTGAATLGATPGATLAAGVDEYEVTFEGGQGLGLAIEDFGKGGKYRTYVSRVIKGSQAERSDIRVPALVVAVNGRNVEGLPKKFVVQLLKEAQQQGGPIVVTFRDPAKFMELLNEKGDGSPEINEELKTQLAPETKTREAQTLTVKKTYVPEICRTGAKYGDLLEVRYATSLEDGTFLDASGMAKPGTAGDSTLYFVLGEQVAGTVPKGWDLSLVGACVGEKREVRVPPVLAYGEKGMKKRGIPPNAIIIYNIEIVGINGNNIPR